MLFQRKDRRHLRSSSTEGRWEQRQQLRGPAWGSALPQPRLPSCSQRTATGSATAMEIKAIKALAFASALLSFAASSLGEGRVIITMKPKGEEPRLPTSSIPGNSQPLLFSKRQFPECLWNVSRLLHALQKAISPSIVLTARNPITEQCACISREQRGKMRTWGLCIPLHFELLSCYIPVHQEYRVRLTAILTSTTWSLPPAWQQSLACYSNRKGTTEKRFHRLQWVRSCQGQAMTFLIFLSLG